MLGLEIVIEFEKFQPKSARARYCLPMHFLLQTPHPWRGIQQRPHHLFARFAARGHAVTWLESRYLAWLLRRPGDFLRPRRESPIPNLAVLPVTLLNGERFAPVRARNTRALAAAFNTAAPPGASASATSTPRVLWIYNPHEAHLADSVPHDLLVYDIMDEYTGFPWSPPRIAEEEAALLGRADLVLAGTGALFDAKAPLARPGRIHCILSGVDTNHFTNPHPNPADAPFYRDLRARFRAIAGCAAMLDLRLDIPLLLAAAAARPDVAFVLLGPARADLSPLRRARNIFLPGARPYADLPAHYRAWDAALLPFVENHLTRHINPTKMLEYAAAGRPIVARALPDVRRFYAGGAWLYNSSEEFIAALDFALAAPPDSPRLAAAQSWSTDRSWDALGDQILALVLACDSRPH